MSKTNNDFLHPDRASDLTKKTSHMENTFNFFTVVISPEHTEALSDEEKKLMENLISRMKDVVEDGVYISYEITDTEFGDEIEFGDERVLIVGCAMGVLDFHHSGVTRCETKSYHKKVLRKFAENNPRFKNIKPAIFVFAGSL